MELVIIITVFGLATIIFLPRMEKNKNLKYLKYFAFVVYLLGYLYFTILSRERETLRTQLVLFNAYKSAFPSGSNFFEVMRNFWKNDPFSGIHGIQLERTSPLEGIILNILLYIPMGYLLPFVWKTLRKHLWLTVPAGFAISLLTEIIQLITHYGWFDVDDLMNNTIGALLGAVLFAVFYRKQEKAKEYFAYSENIMKNFKGVKIKYLICKKQEMPEKA